MVHDVKIEEGLSVENILAQPGDEIRWVNLRKQEAQIEIPNLKAEDLACQREFGNWMGSVQEVVVLKAHESVSLCFKKPAVVNYNVRVDTALAGTKKILPGVIKVGNPMPQ